MLGLTAIPFSQRLYDYVIPVDPIFNKTPANLDLMDRMDLNAAFTKINVWKQTQFRMIVFVDADVVALRAPDELFDIETEFAVSSWSCSKGLIQNANTTPGRSRYRLARLFQ